MRLSWQRLGAGQGLRSWNLFVVFLVVLLPLLALAWEAFFPQNASASGPPPDLIGGRQWMLLARSLVLAIAAGAIGTVLGMLAGVALAAQRPSIQAGLAMASVLPLILPPFIHALAWIRLGGMTGIHVSGMTASALLLGMAHWPIVALLVWNGLVRLPASQREAAAFHPCRWHATWRIHLGLTRPHWLTGFLLISLMSFGDYGLPSLLQVNTYPVLVFTHFAAFYDLRGALATAWPYGLLPVLGLIWWRDRIAPRLFGHTQGGPPQGGSWSPARSAIRSRGLLGVLLTFTAGIPIAVLISAAAKDGAWIQAWQTAHAQVLASVGWAAFAATAMAVLGLAIAWELHTRPPGSARFLEFSILLPIAIPGTLVGMGLIFLWNHPLTEALYRSPLILVLCWLARFLPVAVYALRTGLAQTSRDLFDAGRLSSRGPVRFFASILLPAVRPHLLLAWSLGFVLCLHELAATLLVSPPGLEMLAVRTYSLYHYGAGNLVAALALYLVAGSVAVGWLGWLSLRWKRNS